jgi:glycosyltransferase involved in cell wall biosynthesis
MISFIVPAFDEGRAIIDTMETIHEAARKHQIEDYEIIPIDDGSADDSRSIIENLAKDDPKIRPIYHEFNMGLGKSLVDGINHATKERFIFIPGDNDVSKDSLSLMLKFRDRAELILTVPLNKEVRPIGRQTLSMIYQMLHNMFFGTSVGYINGPGIWPTKKAKELNLVSKRFSIISELNVKLLTSGAEFAEVPVYFQAGEPTRSTVTWENLTEVIKVFVMLVIDLRLKRNRPVLHPLNRVQIDFEK